MSGKRYAYRWVQDPPTLSFAINSLVLGSTSKAFAWRALLNRLRWPQTRSWPRSRRSSTPSSATTTAPPPSPTPRRPPLTHSPQSHRRHQSPHLTLPALTSSAHLTRHPRRSPAGRRSRGWSTQGRRHPLTKKPWPFAATRRVRSCRTSSTPRRWARASSNAPTHSTTSSRMCRRMSLELCSREGGGPATGCWPAQAQAGSRLTLPCNSSLHLLLLAPQSLMRRPACGHTWGKM